MTFSSVPFIKRHFPPLSPLLSPPAREKDVQKVCANSSEEHLQPFKEKMEAFISAGGSRFDFLICGRTVDTETLFHVWFAGYKCVSIITLFNLWFYFFN